MTADVYGHILAPDHEAAANDMSSMLWSKPETNKSVMTRTANCVRLSLSALMISPRTKRSRTAPEVEPMLQDYRDERRKLQTSGRCEACSNQKVLRESGVSHVLEADLQDNHVWLFWASGRGCFGPAFTPATLECRFGPQNRQ